MRSNVVHEFSMLTQNDISLLRSFYGIAILFVTENTSDHISRTNHRTFTESYIEYDYLFILLFIASESGRSIRKRTLNPLGHSVEY